MLQKLHDLHNLALKAVQEMSEEEKREIREWTEMRDFEYPGYLPVHFVYYSPSSGNNVAKYDKDGE